MNNILSIDLHSSHAESRLVGESMDCLASALEPALLDGACRERLRGRVLVGVHARAHPEGTRTLRADQGAWRTLAPGVSIRLLHVDAGAERMTALIRMEPGAALPAHSHEQTEECLVLEGSLTIGAHRLEAGDLHVAPTGTEHAVARSPAGALMLVHARLIAPAG